MSENQEKIALNQEEASEISEEQSVFMMQLAAIASSPSELEYPMTEKDIKLVKEFEEKWAAFLETNPSLIPMGKRGRRNKELRKQVTESFRSKAAVEAELKAQLESIQASRDKFEQQYQQDMANESCHQKEIQNRLQKQLDNVAIAEHLMSKTIPWNHFLETVDEKAVAPEDQVKGNTVKPSARAMALVDKHGNAQEVELRALRIDHALLKSQVQMLDKEVQCYQKTTESLEEIGQLLTENNIWSIITKAAN